MAAKHLPARHAEGDRAKGTGTFARDRAKVPVPFARVPFARSVFVRYTLRSLAANRVRTAVTVAGIALATGLLMAVLTSATSLQNGLANQSRESGGVWQVEFRGTDEGELQALRDAAGDRLDRLALRRDLGAAPFSAADAEGQGTYLSVLTLPEEQGGTARAMDDLDYEVLPSPAVAEGRLPERDGEIALDSSLMGAEPSEGASELPGMGAGVSAEGPIEVGSTVTLSLGRRVAHFEDGTSQEVGAEDGVLYQSLVDGTDPDGTPNVERGEIAETLEGVAGPRAYTVVGFVERDWSLPGTVAYVSAGDAGGAASTRTDAYFSTSCTSHDELTSLVEAVRPAEGERPTVLNGGLLAYEGLTSDRRVFDSLGMFAATLATVVVVAAVSLISNAFTISVSERTRQFGLLSSLGASRRQLRGTVLVEAGALGLVGIPLGVALGIAGATVAFAVTGTGWARIVGTDAAVTLVVRPWCLWLTVLLASATLLVSTAVPALRAGRVSAVDAIRGSRDVRPGRRLRRAFSRRRRAMDDFSEDGSRPRGIAARLGGVPAFLARRTLAASAGKARVAVVSLAVSVTLLVTAGVTGDMLSGASGASPFTVTGFDLELVSADESDAQDVPERSAVLDGADEALEGIAALDGVEGAAYVCESSTTVRLSGGLLGWDAPADGDEGLAGSLAVTEDGLAAANVHLVDDATWRALAEAGRVSPEAADPARLSALLIGTVDVNDGVRYGTRQVLAAGTTGTVELLVLAGREGYDDPLVTWGLDEASGYYPPLAEADGAEGIEVPVSEAAGVVAEVPTTVVPDDLGEDFPVASAQLRTQFPSLVMPARAVRASASALGALRQGHQTTWAYFYARLAEGADASRTLRGMTGVVADLPGVESLGTTNLAAVQRDARAMSFTVRVFLYCFAVILALIAVANVFNTIASGMMLRTREFAALRSAGMGERAFRRMILVECVDYALRGLALGAALSLVVELFLWQAMSLSVSGIEPAVPWAHIAVAFALVVAVLAASAIYALRKTHAMNLVEALRADAL